MKREIHLRSMTKSLIWRFIGIIVLAIITYVFTRNWIVTSFITFCHHAAFLLIYYAHERIWLGVRNPWLRKWKYWFRPITYEIILGHLVLGIISWIFTGSWIKTTLITLVYIENKLWMYVVYDWIWNKIGWRQK